MISPMEALAAATLPLSLCILAAFMYWRERRASYADRVRRDIRRDNLASLVPHTVAARGPKHHTNAYLDPESR